MGRHDSPCAWSRHRHTGRRYRRCLVSSPARLTALAPAKLNLGLAVVGARPDGYHDLVTIMQAISIFDRLTFDLDESGDGATLAVDDPSLGGDDNLVIRAARLLRRRTDTRFGV